VIYVIQEAIQTILEDSAALTTLIGDGTISYKIAPSDTTFPYIVFYEISQRQLNSNATDGIDLYFSVRIMSVSNLVTQQAAEIIRNLFHNQAISITGWNVYRSKVTNQTVFLEQVERIQVYKQTIDFRITMNKES